MIDISIQIDNNVIELVKETVFLGVIPDEHCHGSLTFLAFLEKYQNQ